MDTCGHLRTIESWERDEGSAGPLGATWLEPEQAWNFALYSRYATGVTLLLYGENDFVAPVFRLRLNPFQNKSGRIWHCFVPLESAPAAKYYAYRVEGPWDPSQGHLFDAEKVLFDPFAETVFFPPEFSRDAAQRPGPNDGRAVLGVLPRQAPSFSWGEAFPPRHTHDTIVYELHVKGFTARANSGVTRKKRGTFLGLIEKIPYMKDLGVTVVELLPVHQFDPQEGNYWGYMTLSFFAPHQAYAVRDAVTEFREMVRAFHRAGIEVWLDVVYNHTCESDEAGPTYSYRGIDNRSYYLLDPTGRYQDHSQCGNTTRCAHPSVRALIWRSLQHWGKRMGVDGFRFDLASVFTRDDSGRVDLDAPAVITEISTLAVDLDLCLVAESWDVGAFLLGRSFPGLSWRQWNGQFRDALRSFVKGDANMVPALMRRLYGSDDLFPDGPGDVYQPFQSVNFVTAHDGFCLYDLVSYDQKHNEANGQNNQDGHSDNRSWNCGWEGDKDAPDEVLTLRHRQVRNFFALLMLANGTPMFCAGDEFLNTQRGNNNPYNQDNETTWLDWSRLTRYPDVFRFFRQMIAFRKSHRSIGRSRYWREDVHWYGANGSVDFAYESRSLAYCLAGNRFKEGDLYVMVNAYWEPVQFHIQEGDARDWKRIVDTSRTSPEDIIEPGSEQPIESLEYEVGPRSVVVLERNNTETT
ncbi:MAG: glycogen debranching protein [Solirubrobacterales bacterium]